MKTCLNLAGIPLASSRSAGLGEYLTRTLPQLATALNTFLHLEPLETGRNKHGSTDVGIIRQLLRESQKLRQKAEPVRSAWIPGVLE